MTILWFALLLLHILGGTVSIASGAIAMGASKGGKLHAKAGTWFFGAMLVMGISAAPLALHEPDRLSAVAALLALYLILTSWSAAKRRDGKPGWLERASIPAALTCMIADIALGITASSSPRGELDGNAAAAYFIFAGLAGLAVALDINMLVRGKLSNSQRLTRHLWRMCTAYFLAATSLFLGQQDDVFPFMIGSPILFIPSLLTLIFLAYWIVKLRMKPKPRAPLASSQSV